MAKLIGFLYIDTGRGEDPRPRQSRLGKPEKRPVMPDKGFLRHLNFGEVVGVFAGFIVAAITLVAANLGPLNVAEGFLFGAWLTLVYALYRFKLPWLGKRTLPLAALGGTALAAWLCFFVLPHALSSIHAAMAPKPSANVTLHCIVDSRSGTHKTSFDGLPKYTIYVTALGPLTLTSDQPPQYDASDGALYQLSGETFLRCTIVNNGATPLTNVKVSLQIGFLALPSPIINGKDYVYNIQHPLEVTATADNIRENGGSMEFALVNFAATLMVVRGDTISADGFSTPLTNVERDDATKAFLSGSLTLEPQRRKRLPWLFDDKCSYTFQIPAGVPMRQAVAAMHNAIANFAKHPPPGCTAAAYKAWKSRAEAQEKKYIDSLNH